MSALAIIRGDTAVVIASDGAGYDGATGELRAIVSKVAMMPECQCIFAGRGLGGATAAMENALRQLAARGARLVTFDDVLEVFPTLAAHLHAEAEATADVPTTHFSFMLGGYSARNERLETYTVRTRAFVAPDANGRMVERPPFDLIALPSVHLAPSPNIESAAAVGIQRPQEMTDEYAFEATSYAARAVAACRLDRETDPMEGAAGIHFVGGFLQVTTLTETGVISEIVHRWPDTVGQPLDPKNGALLPDYLKHEIQQA